MRPAISPERWRAVQRLFLEVADLPAPQREEALRLAGAQDPEVEAQVRRMLEFDRQAQTPLDSGAGAADVLRELRMAPAPAAVDPSDPRMASGVPEQIGGFRVVRVIGAGTSGLVLEAEQLSPRRRVAIKLLHPGIASIETRQRFRREADVLARLSHPGVARVIMAGVLPAPDERPYIVLEYIEGRPLIEAARQAGWTLEQRLRVMVRVCEAVQYAHSRGVIHRDLKPDNIVVTPAGDPKVLDFGIARLLGGTEHAEIAASLPGLLLGTAAYMSPEQAGGAAGQSGREGIDTRSDVYALGAITYHLLSGRPPIETEGRPLAEVLADVHRGEIPKLSTLVPAAAGDIEAVVHKAMALDRRERYASVSELEAELKRAAEGEPVLARPPTAMRQLMRLARAHPRTVAAAAAALALGAGGIVMLERTRARAEENFLAASNAADVLLNQVIDRLGPMAATLETRRRIVADLKVPVARFAAARPEDRRLRYNFARLLDAEADLASHDRDWSRALSLRTQAAEILNELCAEDVVLRQWNEARSLVLVKTGDIDRTLGRTDDAVAKYLDALAVDEALVQQFPGDATLNDNLYWSYLRLVESLAGSEPERAKEFRSRAKQQAERLYAMSPERPGSIYVRLTEMAEQAVSGGMVDGPPSAELLAQLQERLRLGQKLQSVSPSNRGHMMRVAGDLGFAAMTYRRLGNLDEAERLWRASRSLIEPMYASDSGDIAVLEHYASNCGIGAELAGARGDRESRACWLREVVTVRRQALGFAGTPGVDRAPSLCEALLDLARELRNIGQSEEAAACEADIVRTAVAFWRSTESPLFVDRFVEICETGRCDPELRAGRVDRVAAEIRDARPGSAVPLLLRASLLKSRGDVRRARAIWQGLLDRSDDCGRHARNELRDTATAE